MDKEILQLLRGAVIGLLSAVVLEFIKHRLEQKRASRLDLQAAKKEHQERVDEFLRGMLSTSDMHSSPPYPAWLRQVNQARRNPLARLGLRSDEDYQTDMYRLAPNRRKNGIGNILLKPFGIREQEKQPLKRYGRKFLLGASHLIGRGSKCDIQILDPAISLIHALIRFEGDQFVLYDLGSTCGTLVNDEPVGDMGIPLQGGELIVMGETSFEFGRVIKAGEMEQIDSILVV